MDNVSIFSVCLINYFTLLGNFQGILEKEIQPSLHSSVNNNMARATNMFSVNVQLATEFQGGLRDTYRVRTNPKGWVLLINNENFESETVKTRIGADRDERNLEILFIQLRFRVLVRRDLTKQNMIEELKR